MKLEEIVSPLDLCKKIPEGHFEDSALVWVLEVAANRHHGEWWEVVYRESTCEDEEFYPAPTLAEIMKEINLCYMLEVRYAYSDEYGWGEWDENDCCSIIDNPAAAALKLWLELRRIEP